MELRHLKYFLVLADELHFGRAAEKLYISQPPLSRQIKQLEEELGVELLSRNNKKVALTPFGKYLKAESEKVFYDLYQIKKNLELMSSTDEGKISIGYVGAVMHSFLPEVLKEIKIKFPNVYFILKELDNESQIFALKRGVLDIGFVRGPLSPGNLESQKVNSSTFSIVLSGSHPLANNISLKLTDLKNEPFIHFSKKCAPPFFESLTSIFKKNSFEPKTIHETSQMHALLKLVENGFGYSLVPSDLKDFNNMNIVFHELKQYEERTEIIALYNENSMSNLISSVIDEIVSTCKQK